MNKYFNVHLEFDKNKIENVIQMAISNNQKGYVCIIESNNLAIANKDIVFNGVVNNSLINTCDGSNIAWLLSHIYKQKLHSYTGNDIFLNFISKKKYKHYFLGNTQIVLNSLKENLSKTDPAISEMVFKELPFKNVADFNYKQIGEDINKNNPDLIWVSLGAPKQELFMSMLLPYINRGIMFGVGAAFNFNAPSGKIKRAPLWMRKNRLEWLYRAFEEPQKNVPRYWNFIKLLPQLMIHEWKQSKKKDFH